MVQIVLVLALAVLWLLTLNNVGGTDFLRVRVFQYGFSIVRVQDMLIGLVIICLIIVLRGPLSLTAAALFLLWGLALFGFPQLFGLEMWPVVAIVIVVGLCVHFVTQRDH